MVRIVFVVLCVVRFAKMPSCVECGGSLWLLLIVVVVVDEDEMKG